MGTVRQLRACGGATTRSRRHPQATPPVGPLQRRRDAGLRDIPPKGDAERVDLRERRAPEQLAPTARIAVQHNIGHMRLPAIERCRCGNVRHSPDASGLQPTLSVVGREPTGPSVGSFARSVGVAQRIVASHGLKVALAIPSGVRLDSLSAYRARRTKPALASGSGPSVIDVRGFGCHGSLLGLRSSVADGGSVRPYA